TFGLLSPSKTSTGRTRCRQRIKCGLVRSFVEHLGLGALFRLAYGDGLTIDYLRYTRLRVVEVAHHDGLRWTHRHAGWLQPSIDPVRTEVALLGRVVFRINEDCIVRTGRDTGFAADTYILVEINDAIIACVHCTGRTRIRAGRIHTLIAARNLKSTARIGEFTDIDRFDIST